MLHMQNLSDNDKDSTKYATIFDDIGELIINKSCELQSKSQYLPALF